MPYSIELPDGTLIADVPDDVDPDTAVTNVGRSDPKVAKFAPQTKLASPEGAMAVGVAEAAAVGQTGLGLATSMQREAERVSQQPPTSVPFLAELQQRFGLTPPPPEAITGQVYSPEELRTLEMRQQLQARERELLPVNPSEPLRHAQGIAASTVLNLPGFAASIATGTPIPALAGAGLTSYGAGYEEARRGGATPDTAATSAGLQAIPEVALELWPVAKFLKEIGTEPLLKAAAKFVGREEVTELGTTASQELIKWAVENPEMPVGTFLSKAGQALIDTAIQTPFSAGLMAGTGALIAPVTGGNTRTEPPSPPTPTPPPQPYQPDIPALLQPPAPVQPTEGLTKEEAGPEPQLSTGPVEPDLEAGQAILDSIGMETELPATPPPVAVLPQNVELAAELDAVNEFMDVGEVPQSHRSMMNAENYTTPNDGIPRSQRVVLVGPKEVVGKRYGEVDWSTQPKTTIILGEPSVDRPLPYLKAVRGVYEALRSTFTPDAGLVISNETIQNRTGAGWHYRMQGGTHLIVPTPLRRVGEVEVKKFNPVTLARSFFNIFHEFGHMLAEARFLEKLDPATRDEFLNVMGSGPIPARLIIALEQADPAAGAVVRDWQSRIARILDGKMTAEEFRREWWGPAKVRHSTLLKDLGVAPNAPAKDLIAAIAMRTVTGDRTGAMDSMQVAAARAQQMRRYTSFHEFFAEQLARHAEAKGASSASPFFQGALNSLRMYFRKLKQGIFDAEGTEYKIEAGTSFQEWIEGMGGMAKALEKIAKSGGKVARVTKGVRAKAPAPKTAPAKPQGPPKGLTPVQETLLGLMDIHPSGPTVDKARELVLLGRVQEAQDLLADAMEGRIQWELDEEAVVGPQALYTSQFLEALPQKPEITKKEAVGLVNKLAMAQAERRVVKEVLGQPEFSGERFPREALVGAVTAKAMPLTPRTYNNQASVMVTWGTESITKAAFGRGYVNDPNTPPPAVKTYPINGTFVHVLPTANVWRTEQPWYKDPHFGDTNYFAHTRGFDVGPDMRVLFEVQSNLFQGDTQGLTPEEQATIQETIKQVDAFSDFVKKSIGREEYIEALGRPQWYHLATVAAASSESADIPNIVLGAKILGDRERALRRLQLLRSETVSRLQQAVGPGAQVREDFSPIWTRRIIREEVRKAANEGKRTLRWSTANTMAKVEGWSRRYIPQQSISVPELKGRNFTEDAYGRPITFTGELRTGTYGVRAAVLSDGSSIQVESGTLEPTISDERLKQIVSSFKRDFGSNQPIWNRHKKSIEDYIRREYGGREVTDELGNTWIEMDVPATARRPVINWDIDLFDVPAVDTTINRLFTGFRDFDLMGEDKYSNQAWILPDGSVKRRNFHHVPDGLQVMRSVEAGGEELLPQGDLEQRYFDTNVRSEAERLQNAADRVLDAGAIRWIGNSFEFGIRKPTTAQIEAIFDVISGRPFQMARGITLGMGMRDSNEFPKPESPKELARMVNKVYAEKRKAYITDTLRWRWLPGGLPEGYAQLPETVAEARADWEAKGPKSKFFKAWFGDWERSQFLRSQVTTAEGKPLVVYTTTRDTGEFIFPTDIGYHASALPEVVDRSDGGAGPLKTLPMYMKVMNPLDIGVEDTKFWDSPAELAAQIHRTSNAVTADEALRIAFAEQAFIEDANRIGEKWDKASLFTNLRELLLEKGYDGLKYKSLFHGGTSWVALKPDQMKSAAGDNVTFSKSPSILWDTDFDLSTEEGAQSAGLLRRLQKFGLNNSWLRGYLRWQMKFATDAVEGQQIAALHPDVLPLQNMQINGDKYIQSRSGLFLGPVDMLNWLRWKGKENAARMWKTILREVSGKQHTLTTITGVPGRWEQQPTPQLREELLASGIRPEQVDEVALRVLQIKQSWLDIYNYAAKVMAGRYFAKFSGTKSPAELAAYIKVNVYDVLAGFVNTPFFPDTSFGDAAVVMEQKNSRGQWVPIYRRFYESERKMEKALVEADTKNKIKNNPNIRIVPVTKIEKRIGVLVNLPKEFIDEVAEQLDLTVSERNQLEQLMHPSKMDRVTQMFGKRVLGGTNDYARNYADFVWHTVNSLAKMEYAGKFTRNIRDMRRMVEAAREIEDPLVRIMEERRLSTIENWMHRTKEYILNPPNEHQRLRTGIALTYLWLMPKTALMNFFGLMTTATHLSAKYNPIVGSKRFMQAMDEALTSASPFEGGKGNNPEIDALIERATKDGLITESYAYHIAAVATEGTLGRLPGQSVMELFKERGIDAGLFLFRTAEHATRRVALIAAWHEGRDEGMNPDEAYQYAYRQTKLQQNSFNPFDRPVWMRGEVVAPATVFYGFTQHMMFHAFGGYELGMRRKSRQQGRTPRSIWGGYTMQLWGMILLLAGYEGLPMAEDWLNLLDPLFRRTFGKSARQYMRENMKWFEEITGLDSAILAHGLAHDVAGVSVSRSIGLGKMVPGSDFFKEGSTAMESFANLALGMLGPLGGILGWGVKAAFGDRDALGKLSSFPGAVGAWSTALSWGLNGAKDPVGASLITDPQGRPVDPSAGKIIMRGLGFQSTEIANTRERRFAQQEGKEYWSERRSRLLRDRATAQVERDREAIADTTAAIREFNAELPPGWRAMAIRPEQIRQSIKSRIDEIRARETEVPRQKSYRGLYREIGEAYK